MRFPENNYNVPEEPDGRTRTHGANTPAHLPAMNLNKAPASEWEEGGWLIRAWIQGRLHEARSGCRNPAKGAMRHFGKSQTGRLSALPENIL
jgi:hypothetical protein